MPTLKEQISKKKKELKSLEGRLKKQIDEKKKKRTMDAKKKYVKNQTYVHMCMLTYESISKCALIL